MCVCVRVRVSVCVCVCVPLLFRLRKFRVLGLIRVRVPMIEKTLLQVILLKPVLVHVAPAMGYVMHKP